MTLFAGYPSETNYEKEPSREVVGDNFENAMADVPPFAGANAAVLAETVAAPLEVVDTVAETDGESGESGESGDTYNANGEAQTNPASVVEQVAKDHTERGDVDPNNVLQDAGAAIGREGVENTNTDVNLTIAQNAAENINPQESNGTKQALNLLSETEAATAIAKAKAEGAVLDTINNNPGATFSKAEAEESLSKAESAVDTLNSAASKVQSEDPSVASKVVTGAESMSRVLQESRDMLTAEVDRLAAEQDAADGESAELLTSAGTATEESTADAESITAIGATPGASGDIMNSTPNGNETTSIAPGQLNADTVRMLQEQREDEKKKAVEAALKAQRESAPKEQLEGRQSL